MIKSKLPIILGILVLLTAIFAGCSDDGNKPDPAVKVTGITLKAGENTSGTSTIYLDSTSAGMPASVTFTATVAPENATNKTVQWTVTPDTFVTWNEATRTATAKAVGGPTTVTVTTADGAKTATWTITVANASNFVAVTGVSITPADELEFDKPVGSDSFVPANITLTATVLPEGVLDKSVVWKSDDEEVATVANGVVTPVGKGVTHISATSVTVGSDGEPVESTNKVRVEVTIGGEALIEVESISIAPAAGLTFNKPLGGSFTPATGSLTATVLPADAWKITVTWSSEDEDIATVDNQGVVTPVGNGSTYIVATSDGDTTKIAKVPVTVTVAGAATVPVESLAITPHTTLEFNKPHGGDFAPESVELEVTVHPTNATNKLVTWSSTNTAVATVNAQTGVVTPVGAGSAVIKVTSNADSSKTDQVNVTVTVEAAPLTLKLVNQTAATGATTAAMPDMDSTTKRFTINNANTSAGIAAGDSGTGNNGVTGATFVYLDKTVTGNTLSISARVRMKSRATSTGSGTTGVLMGLISDLTNTNVRFMGIRATTNSLWRPYNSRSSNTNSSAAMSAAGSSGYAEVSSLSAIDNVTIPFDEEFIMEFQRTGASAYTVRLKDYEGRDIASGSNSSALNITEGYLGFIIANAEVEISQITITEGTTSLFTSSVSIPTPTPAASVVFTAPAEIETTATAGEFTYEHSTMGGNMTQTFTANVLPKRAPSADKVINWAVTSGPASVSSNTGDSVLVTFSATTGTAVITASAGGKSAKLTIEIVAGPILVNEITINATGTSIMSGVTGEEEEDTIPPETLQLSASVEPGNAANKNVTWSISDTSTFSGGNTSGCTIDATGLLTAPANYTGADFNIYIFAQAADTGAFTSDGKQITVKKYAKKELAQPQIWRTDITSASPAIVQPANNIIVSEDHQTLTIKGIGIMGATTNCNFVYFPITGTETEFTIIAKVQSFTFANFNAASRAGIMVLENVSNISRDSSTGALTGVTSSNKYGATALRPGTSPAVDVGRLRPGSNYTAISGVGLTTSSTNFYIRLSGRLDNGQRRFYSACLVSGTGSGTSAEWNALTEGNQTTADTVQGAAYVGLFVGSNDNAVPNTLVISELYYGEGTGKGARTITPADLSRIDFGWLATE